MDQSTDQSINQSINQSFDRKTVRFQKNLFFYFYSSWHFPHEKFHWINFKNQIQKISFSNWNIFVQKCCSKIGTNSCNEIGTEFGLKFCCFSKSIALESCFGFFFWFFGVKEGNWRLQSSPWPAQKRVLWSTQSRVLGTPERLSSTSTGPADPTRPPVDGEICSTPADHPLRHLATQWCNAGWPFQECAAGHLLPLMKTNSGKDSSTQQSPWVETRGVPMVSRRGQISLAVFSWMSVLPHVAGHCFNSGTVPTQALWLCFVDKFQTSKSPRHKTMKTSHHIPKA